MFGLDRVDGLPGEVYMEGVGEVDGDGDKEFHGFVLGYLVWSRSIC